MDWLNEYAGLFVVILLGLVLALTALLIAMLIMLNKANKSLSTSALVITAGINYDSDNLAEGLVITIFNNNYRDILVHDFGFLYKNQHISLIEEYTERKTVKGRACVPARSSLSYKVNPERIEKFVVAHNFNAQTIDAIRLYVYDSVGNKVLVKDKELTAIFSSRQKARIKLAKLKIHEDGLQDYMAGHEGARPFTDRIWRAFHKTDIKIPKLLKTNARFIDDQTVTPENATRRSYNPAPIKSSDPDEDPEDRSSLVEEKSFGSSRDRTDTRDMKVTFIDLDVPLKGKTLESKEKHRG